MNQGGCIKPAGTKGRAASSAGPWPMGPNALRPGAYWFWHRLPGPAEISRQLEEIKSAGYGTVYIQPRLAFPRSEYLSPAYLQAYDRAMDQCAELGLSAVLYDDYNWISGHAGGRTVAGSPEVQEHHLFWSTIEVGAASTELEVSGIRSLLIEGLGTACANWLYEGGGPKWGEWTLQSILVHLPAQNPEQPTRKLQDLTNLGRITSATDKGCRVSLSQPDDLPKGSNITAFVSAKCQNSRLINYLHPDSGKAFIRAGYMPYAEALKRHFGDPLVGIFFDQPYSGFYTWEQSCGDLSNSLMFHESLAAEYQARHGADISRAWLALAASNAAESAKLRCDFFDTYGHMARQSFFEPIRKWAHGHGLAVSGHELLGCVGQWGLCGGLGEMDSRVNFGGDHFALEAFKDISAVDACNSAPQLSSRLGSSLAKSQGRKGSLVEQYFAARGDGNPAEGHWGLTLEELRGLSIRHLLQGASQVVFHGYYQTDGWSGDPTPLANPRHDFAPGINFEPWFSHHVDSARELEHLAGFMAGAGEQAPVAVLYPLRTYWHGGTGHLFNTESAWWHEWLSREGYGFDLVDERQLIAGELTKYQALILPGVEVLAGEESLAGLSGFLEQGGLLIASGILPCQSQAMGMDRELFRRIKELFGPSLRAVSLPPVSRDNRLGKKVYRLLSQGIEPGVRISPESSAAGQLWTWTGRDKAGWRVALFNEGPEPRRVELAMNQKGYLPWIGLKGGGPVDWPWHENTPDASRMWLDMEPNQLALLGFSKAARADEGLPYLISVPKSVMVRNPRRDQPDGLSARLELTREGAGELVISSGHEPRVRAPGVKINRVSQNRRDWKISYHSGPLSDGAVLDGEWRISREGRDEARDIDPRRGWQDIWPDFSGVASYQTGFDLPECGPGISWRLILPRVVCAVTCRLNGELIATRGWPPYRFDLPAKHLKGKSNRLCLDIANTATNRFSTDRSGLRGGGFESGLIGYPRLRPVKCIELKA
jgi:hypothetical protein